MVLNIFAIFLISATSVISRQDFCATGKSVTQISRANSGFFSAPIDARTGEYYPMQRCSWNITVQPGSRIRFFFSLFELAPPYLYQSPGLTESVTRCGCDRVTIFDGPSMDNDEFVIDSLCGDVTKPNLPLLSFSNHAIVHFCTDYRAKFNDLLPNPKYRGFTIYFDEIRPSNVEEQAKTYPHRHEKTKNFVFGFKPKEKYSFKHRSGSKIHFMAIPTTESPKIERELCPSRISPYAISLAFIFLILVIGAVWFLIEIWVKEDQLLAKLKSAAYQEIGSTPSLSTYV